MSSMTMGEELAELRGLTAAVTGGGWCRTDEQDLLYRLARDGPGAGAVVEIGSWQGLSTICLAAGSKRRGREPVTAIDPFEVVPLAGFTANIARAGLGDWVRPVVGLSYQVAATWGGVPIRLLYVDGNHDYEAVCRDYADWAPWVIPGGLIAFHDAVEPGYPGVSRALDEVLDSASWARYRLLSPTMSSIVVAQKRAAAGDDLPPLDLGEGVFVTLRELLAHHRQHYDQLERYTRDLEAKLGAVQGEFARAARAQEQLAAALRAANPIKHALHQLARRARPAGGKKGLDA